VSQRTLILAGITVVVLVVAIVASAVGNGTDTGLFVTAAAFAVGTFFNWRYDRNNGDR